MFKKFELDNDNSTKSNAKNISKNSRNLNKGNIFGYDNNFYEVSSISSNIYFSKNLQVQSNEQFSINDNKIVRLFKNKQIAIKNFSIFTEKHNRTISALNKKKGLNFPLTELSFVVKLNENVKINVVMLDNLLKKLNLTCCNKYTIDNLVKNPFGLITQEEQLISYEKAEEIDEFYGINTSYEIKVVAWTYDIFLKKFQSYYVPYARLYNEFRLFCETKNIDYNLYLNFINENCIDYTINKIKYKTTNYLLNFRKRIQHK